MDYDAEIDLLAAETLALQTLLAHLLDHLFKIGDLRLNAAIQKAFSEAASELENLGLDSSKAPDSVRSVKALGVIEYLRTAALGDHEKPKRGV
jgi:hypothetical protein